MATRKVKAQNPESWKSEASRCLRSFHHGLFLTHSSSAQRFHIKDVLTVQKNQVRLFFFSFFFFSVTNQISLESFSIIYILCFFFFLHQETPRTSTSSESSPTWRPTTQRSWSEGVCTSDTPSGSSAELPAEEQRHLLEKCSNHFPYSHSLGRLAFDQHGESWSFIHHMPVWFSFCSEKKKSPFKVDQSEEILILWCCRSCVEQLHESCAVKKMEDLLVLSSYMHFFLKKYKYSILLLYSVRWDF